MRMSGLAECSEREPVFGFFPFTEKFSEVLSGDVSMQYLRELRLVLEPAVDLLQSTAQVSEVSKRDVVQASLFIVAALGRISAVEAYTEEISNLDVYDECSLLSAIEFEWENMVDRDGLLTVALSPFIREFFYDLVCDVWQVPAVSGFMTVDQLCEQFRPLVSKLRFVRVCDVMVVTDKGVKFEQLLTVDRGLPVLSVKCYRELLMVVRDDRCHDDDGRVDPHRLFDCCFRMSVSMHVASCDITAWVWLLAYGKHKPSDYCYQDLFPPSQRLMVCQVLGKLPMVDELLWYLGDVAPEWAGRTAVLVVKGQVHVAESGDPVLEDLRQYVGLRIGVATPSTPEVDFFAKALLDDFVARHRPEQDALSRMAPLDTGFEELSLDVSSVGRRGFVDVAFDHYAGVGEVLSPRAESGGQLRIGLAARDDVIDGVDGERMRALHSRLLNGPAIDEGYFRHAKRRFLRSRRRPGLEDNGGRGYHLFWGFQAEDGAGLGPWVEDADWNVPGWSSYVAEFKPGFSQTVAFCVPGGNSMDTRMDVSGAGAMEFGDCLIGCSGTVLWFSNSVRFKLITNAKNYVDIRISVPVSGSAPAIPRDMRRYLQVPGYALVAYSFDVVTGRPSLMVPVTRSKQRVCAGCQVFVGSQHVERGRHRFKLTQLPSAAPVKLLIKTEPVEVLDFVSVCGMRIKSRTRDYICVLYDVTNADAYVALSEEAYLHVSVMQVVNFQEYDLTLASANMKA